MIQTRRFHLDAHCSQPATAWSQGRGGGKPDSGSPVRVDVRFVDDASARITSGTPGIAFEGTIDDDPPDRAGAKLNFKTGRDEILRFEFPDLLPDEENDGGCADWFTDTHGLANPVEDNATFDIRLTAGKWLEMEEGDSTSGHVKVNPETKRKEFWWVLRYNPGFTCENCTNASDYVTVVFENNGWTVSGDLAWVHANFDRPDGANCSMPFTLRVERSP